MKKSVKKFIYEKFPHILKKKILLYTCSHNYAEINGKLKKKKKATVRQRKLNTVHLLRTSSTIKIHCFPSSDHRSHFSLELAVVKKLRQAQLVWLRGLRWYSTQCSASDCCTNQVSSKYPSHMHTHAPVTGVSIILHGCFINLLSHIKK